ncbi:MAG: DUF1592 domain-containing protein, partial [Myxococcales bacterium]|nr:DUF1592 domain-containing protein [Myxococcales bacterium]
MANSRQGTIVARTIGALAIATGVVGCRGDEAHGGGAQADAATGVSEGSGGESGDDAADSTGEPGTEDGIPGALVLPRLTSVQYRNSLVALLGPGLPPTPVEPDTNPYLFFSIGAASTTLSELGTGQYEEAADRVTHFVFDDPTRRSALLGCEPASPGDACVSQFLASFGRRAYRRPLTADEHARWLAISVQLAQPDAWEGVRMAVAGMLQSPHFLYRVETGVPDPERPGILRYTGYEMASRLSFLLWDSMPDDALFAAADRGDLDDVAGIRTEVERMLADERARTTVQSFFAQYLDLGRIDGVTR